MIITVIVLVVVVVTILFKFISHPSAAVPRADYNYSKFKNSKQLKRNYGHRNRVGPENKHLRGQRAR